MNTEIEFVDRGDRIDLVERPEPPPPVPSGPAGVEWPDRDEWISAQLEREKAKFVARYPRGAMPPASQVWDRQASPHYLVLARIAWEKWHQTRMLERAAAGAACARPAPALAPPLPLAPYAASLVLTIIYPPWACLHREAWVLLPLSAPGAGDLLARLGLGEGDCPDLGEPFFLHQSGARLTGRHLVLCEAVLVPGDPPSYCVPDGLGFDPQKAATLTKGFAHRPPSYTELRVKADLAAKAEADRRERERRQRAEAEAAKVEEARRRANPLIRVGELGAEVRRLTEQLGRAVVAGQAADLLHQLDALRDQLREVKAGAEKNGGGHV
jgi:hypothetical protein